MQNIDEPIFETKAFKLNKLEESLSKKARELGIKKFANRAFKYDDDAVFPIENYKDLYKEGFLGICIPKSQGGLAQVLEVML